jgi:dihydroneopterin aldolase
MQQPVELLESLVKQMAQAVHKKFSEISEVTVSVEKLNPPIDRFSGSAKVTYTEKFQTIDNTC